MKTPWRIRHQAHLRGEHNSPAGTAAGTTAGNRSHNLGSHHPGSHHHGHHGLNTVLLWGLLLGTCTWGLQGCSSAPPEPPKATSECCYFINSNSPMAYIWWFDRKQYRLTHMSDINWEFYREFNWRK